MRDALSLLDQCIAFYLGQELTYDKVLEVLGAVDTEVFSKLLRKVIRGDVTGSIHILEELIGGSDRCLIRQHEASERREHHAGCGDADAVYPYFFGFVQPDPICNPEKGSRGDCTDQAVPSCNGD